MGFMAPEQTVAEETPNVKMKMSEEEGPGEGEEFKQDKSDPPGLIKGVFYLFIYLSAQRLLM